MVLSVIDSLGQKPISKNTQYDYQHSLGSSVTIVNSTVKMPNNYFRKPADSSIKPVSNSVSVVDNFLSM